MWIVVVVACLKYCPSICLKRLAKTMKDLGKILAMSPLSISQKLFGSNEYCDVIE
jgi:hypothetical protein